MYCNCIVVEKQTRQFTCWWRLEACVDRQVRPSKTYQDFIEGQDAMKEARNRESRLGQLT